MLATITKGEAAARRDLRVDLALERLTGQPDDGGYINADMQRGIDLEPIACAEYEAVSGNIVARTGFLAMHGLMAGCSLDGHLGDFDVLVSFKCPKKATHLKNLRSRTIPSEYVPQMLHEMFVTGAREYHFVSFDDRFPESLRTSLVVVKRDEQAIAEYEATLRAFLAEVDTELASIATMLDTAAAFKASLAVA
jgi:hypothetical protein